MKATSPAYKTGQRPSRCAQRRAAPNHPAGGCSLLSRGLLPPGRTTVGATAQVKGHSRGWGSSCPGQVKCVSCGGTPRQGHRDSGRVIATPGEVGAAPHAALQDACLLPRLACCMPNAGVTQACCAAPFPSSPSCSPCPHAAKNGSAPRHTCEITHGHGEQQWATTGAWHCCDSCDAT